MKEKWYQKTWFIVIMLILFAPVGIALLWARKDMKKVTKVILTVVFGFIFLFAIIPSGDNENLEGSSAINNEQEQEQENETKKSDVITESEESSQENVNTEEEEKEAQVIEEEKIEETIQDNTIKSGTYKVGTDIESGLYKVKLVDFMGYVERSSSASMDFDSIIANNNFTGDGYIKIKDTDAFVKLQGVEITPDIVEDIKEEVKDGIYLVGVDLLPGTYKVIPEDGMAYIERVKDVSFEMNDIIANDLFEGQGYVEISETDYAIKVQGATLTKAE